MYSASRGNKTLTMISFTALGTRSSLRHSVQRTTTFSIRPISLRHLQFTIRHSDLRHSDTDPQQGRSQKFVWGVYKLFFLWGKGIKLLNSRSDIILPHKKFTWADLGGGINTNIHPVATPLAPNFVNPLYILNTSRTSDQQRAETVTRHHELTSRQLAERRC